MTTTPAPTDENANVSSAAHGEVDAPKNARARFAARVSRVSAFVAFFVACNSPSRAVVSADAADAGDAYASPAAAARAAVNARVRRTSQSARFAFAVATREDGVASAKTGVDFSETDDAYVVSTANVSPASSVSATTSARSSSVVTNAYAQSVADVTSQSRFFVESDVSSSRRF